MKRKLLWLLLAAALLCAVAAIAAGCGEEPPPEETPHAASRNWGFDDESHWHVCTAENCGDIYDKAPHEEEQKILKEATCLQSGEVLSTCKVCGRMRKEQLAPLGHDLQPHEAKAATCSEGGWKAYETCLRCDYSTFEATEKLGHDLQSGVCLHCSLTAHDLFNGTYGYDALAAKPNGEAMQTLYRHIDDAVREFHDETDAEQTDPIFAEIDFSALGVTSSDAASVLKTYKDDNPLYYWFSNTATIVGSNLQLHVDDLYAAGETRAAYNALIDQKVNEFRNLLHKDSGAYDKALAYHDLIISSVDYMRNDDLPQIHSVIGVFSGSGAVCDGYARTFQLLLNFSGVENVFVTGKSGDELHAWNLVKLDDGKWYWCDLTFDDMPQYVLGISYDYFCAGDETFLDDHTFDTSDGTGAAYLYDLPVRPENGYSSGTLQIGDTFTVNGNTYAVAGHDRVAVYDACTAGDYCVPETVTYAGRTYRVSILGGENERNILADSITSVFIPETVLFIWDYALQSNSLQVITVARDNPKFASSKGVLFTKSLYTLIQYPSASGRSEYTVPDETQYIAYQAFTACSYLEKLTFGKNVSNAGVVNWGAGFPDGIKYGMIIPTISGDIRYIHDALSGKKEIVICKDNPWFIQDETAIYSRSKTNLELLNRNATEYRLPETIQNIEAGVFDGCDLLQRISVEEGNLWFAAQDGILYNKDMTEIEYVPNAIQGQLNIPDTITSISFLTFFDKDSLESIVLPQTVRSIGHSAFSGCKNLRSVIVQDGIESIGHGAFLQCESLESIFLPDSITQVDENSLFSSCQSLKYVRLPSSLTSIGEYMFYTCVNLESVDLPAAIRSIGSYSFQLCTSLHELTLPENVALIEANAFLDSGLTRVTFDDPEGWSVNGEPIDAELLRDPETAAKLLTETYVSCEWEKN